MWVEQGIISSDQASQIREYENHVASADRIALEVLGYIGGALILAAGVFVFNDVWPNLGRVARILILVVATGLLVATGIVATLNRGDPRRRLGQLALMLAVPTAGVAAGLAFEVAAPGWAAFTGFGVAAATALGFYLRRQSAPQHLALFAATIGLVVSAPVQSSGPTDEALLSLVVLGFGIWWAFLATQNRIRPMTLGEVLGAGAATVGSVAFVSNLDQGSAFAMIALVLTSAGVIWFGLSRDRTTLIVSGMIGVVVYVPWVITKTFGDSVGGPLALLTAGILLIGSATALMRRQRT